MTSTSGMNGHPVPDAADRRGDIRLNDPLAGMTAKQIWTDCVWLSEESTSVKIVLLCIGRFFDDEARSSSMSYGQIVSDCGLHESTAKKIVRAVGGGDYTDKPVSKWIWVAKEVGAGYKSFFGQQNLYHGKIPDDLVEQLRAVRKNGGSPHDPDLAATVDGVAGKDPVRENGVAQEDPDGGTGSLEKTRGVAQEDPYSYKTPKKRKETAGRVFDPAASAVELYNSAARQYEWTECKHLTPERARRVQRRLDETGGLDAWKQALDVIPRDDFLMGRVRPRHSGDKPFKLNIDRLLQTEGGMGDVLAKLLDMAAEQEPAAKTFDDELRELQKKRPDVPVNQLREAIAQSRRSRGFD